jgi:hypothetical protein
MCTHGAQLLEAGVGEMALMIIILMNIVIIHLYNLYDQNGLIGIASCGK